MFQESILGKRGIRSDAFWTIPFVYQSILKYIPLFMDTWVLMRSQFWAREKIEKMQTARLRELLRDVGEVPYWDQLLKHSGIKYGGDPLSELRKLPVTSKRELMEEMPERISNPNLVSRSDPDHTSGSTGKPFPFRQDWHASLRSFAVTERIFRTATGTRYPIVYMRARPRNGFTPYKHVWFFARSYNGIAHRMEEMRKLGEKLSRGFILYGYTSWVLEVARQMESLKMKLPLKAVMVAGEHLSKQDATVIQNVTGAELFTFYASRETGFLAYECSHHRLHLSEEWAFFEVVDSAGKPLLDGEEGRLLVTTFDNRIMPFIRYDLGDRAIIQSDGCACGRTLKTITFRGRTAEIIELEEGRRVALLDVAANIDWYWETVRQFQIVQKSLSSFHLKVVPGPRFEQGRAELETALVRLLHPRVKITWELVDSIPEAASGKAAYFVRDFN